MKKKKKTPKLTRSEMLDAIVQAYVDSIELEDLIEYYRENTKRELVDWSDKEVKKEYKYLTEKLYV